MKHRLIALIVVSFFYCSYSQEINIRTIPLVSETINRYQPSVSAGMGNMSISINDSISDPFVNPAAAGRLSGLKLFVSPSRSTWSNADAGSMFSITGNTKYTGTVITSIPFGFYYKYDNFFYGGMFTYQSLSSDRLISSWQEKETLKKDNGKNIYSFALAGYTFPSIGYSIAASVSWKDNHAYDGVNLLYPGSIDISQYGWSIEYKLGLLAPLSSSDELQFATSFSKMKATHEVVSRPVMSFDLNQAQSYVSEINKDETDSWLIHSKYTRKLTSTLTAGILVTVNWKDHPKIPNYRLADIPRDPGNSTAYNFGFGIISSGSRRTGGFEYIFEPIKSHTWAESEENALVPVNYNAVDNYFNFYNHILRGGIFSRTEYSWLNFTLGAQLKFYNYSLTQYDNRSEIIELNENERRLNENWIEAAFTGGFIFIFSNIQLTYGAQLTMGNGLVSIPGSPLLAHTSLRDFLIAPSDKFRVDKISHITQQISILVNF